MKYVSILTVILLPVLLSSAEDTVEELPPYVRILSINPSGGATSEKKSSNKNAVKRNQLRDITDLNAWADGIITPISEGILSGSDPAPIASYRITFEYRPLLITYTGTLDLTRGSIQELSTVSRAGDVVLSYSVPPGSLKVSVPLAFRNIILTYNFEMNVRGDTVIGVLYAWLTSPRADYARFTSETIDDHEFTLNIGTFNLNIFSGDMSSTLFECYII
ncbi:Group 7 allergen [Popillia japonica]|uniref:Group 7 allergen n=1 Tax=Popillia japonica TaxID=7064 RepID=A0AAW1N7M5_POPJA